MKTNLPGKPDVAVVSPTSDDTGIAESSGRVGPSALVDPVAVEPKAAGA